MTDLELLRLAAKNVGLSFTDQNVYYHGVYCNDATWWNPLTDDGDAFRLAIKLGISVGPTFAGNKAVAFIVSTGHVVEVPYGDDRNYSTRLAIVQAAAEIGKQLQD